MFLLVQNATKLILSARSFTCRHTTNQLLRYTLVWHHRLRGGYTSSTATLIHDHFFKHWKNVGSSDHPIHRYQVKQFLCGINVSVSASNENHTFPVVSNLSAPIPSNWICDQHAAQLVEATFNACANLTMFSKCIWLEADLLKSSLRAETNSIYYYLQALLYEDVTNKQFQTIRFMAN